MKKYIIILGLALMMAGQSVFGMNDTKAPAKVPAKVATTGDKTVMNELTQKLQGMSLKTSPKSPLAQPSGGAVTSEHPRPSLDASNLPPRVPAKTGGAVTSEHRPSLDAPPLPPRVPAKTGGAVTGELRRPSLDTANLSPRVPVNGDAVTSERRPSLDTANRPPRVPAKRGSKNLGARTTSAEDKQYEPLAKNYYDACLNKVYVACGPNASTEQKKVLRQILGETLERDMKQCIETCDQALAICEATMQKCQGLRGQTAIDESNKMWETYPIHELAGYTLRRRGTPVDETSFLGLALQAMFEALKDTVKSKSPEEFCAMFPLEANQHVLLIPHAKKLAEGVLGVVTKKRKSTQTSLKIFLQPTIDEKEQNLWCHQYIHERLAMVLAAYGPHAEEYKAMLIPTIEYIIKADMIECLALINEFMPTLQKAVIHCEALQTRGEVFDEEEAHKISDAVVKMVPKELKRYLIEVDQDPYCFYIGRICQASCAKALQKKRGELTDEEVENWFGKKYPLKVTQLTMALKYAQTFAYEVLNALGVQNIHLD